MNINKTKVLLPWA